jgi:hypothetical protein
VRIYSLLLRYRIPVYCKASKHHTESTDMTTTAANFTPVHFSKTTTEPGPFLVITTTKRETRAYITETEFKTAREARAYCNEETQWESCQRVQCPALGIDERGSFA